MTSGIRKAVLFVLTAFVLSVFDSASAAEHAWKLQKNADGISVFTREVENSPILELRGETEVNAGVSDAVGLYEQVDRMGQWFHRSKEVKLLKRVSADESLIYFAADLPWPLWDRDGVYRRMKSVNSLTGVVIYKLRAETAEAFPRYKDRVRVNYLDGEWCFSPLPNGRTAVSYRMHTEAGGYIPSRVVNRFTVSLPFKTLHNFRAILEKAV